MHYTGERKAKITWHFDNEWCMKASGMSLFKKQYQYLLRNFGIWSLCRLISSLTCLHTVTVLLSCKTYRISTGMLHTSHSVISHFMPGTQFTETCTSFLVCNRIIYHALFLQKKCVDIVQLVLLFTS